MENTPDMDDMINEVVKELGKSEESSTTKEHFQFIGQFEEITTKELEHQHVQVVAKDIAVFQNDPDLAEILKRTFPEKEASKEKVKGLVDSLRSLSFEEIQFVDPEKEEAIIYLLTILADDYRKPQKGEKALIKKSGINRFLRCIQLNVLSEDLYQKGSPLCINRSEDVDLLEKVRLMGFIEGSMVARNEIFDDEELQKIIQGAIAAKTVRKGRRDVTRKIEDFLLSIATQKWEKADKTYHNNMADYLLELVFDELVFNEPIPDKEGKIRRKFNESGKTKDSQDVLKIKKFLESLRSEYSDKKIYYKLPGRLAMMNVIKPTAHEFGRVRGVNKKGK
jgi:hypothetical protein